MASIDERHLRVWQTVPYSFTTALHFLLSVTGVTVSPEVGDIYQVAGVQYELLTVDIESGEGEIVMTGASTPPAAPDAISVITGDGDAAISYDGVDIVNVLYITIPSGVAKVLCSTSNASATMALDADDYTVNIDISGCTATYEDFFWTEQHGKYIPPIYYDFDTATTHTIKFKFDIKASTVINAMLYFMPELAISTAVTESYDVE
jgi:hypothetical protein